MAHLQIRQGAIPLVLQRLIDQEIELPFVRVRFYLSVPSLPIDFIEEPLPQVSVVGLGQAQNSVL